VFLDELPFCLSMRCRCTVALGVAFAVAFVCGGVKRSRLAGNWHGRRLSDFDFSPVPWRFGRSCCAAGRRGNADPPLERNRASMIRLRRGRSPERIALIFSCSESHCQFFVAAVSVARPRPRSLPVGPLQDKLAQNSGGSEFVLNVGSSKFNVRLVENKKGGTGARSSD